MEESCDIRFLLGAARMLSSLVRNLKKVWSVSETDPMRVIKKGPAMRVIFFYPGEEGTYVDHADVTLYENGAVHITSNQEETTTHLQNCEILWRFETEAEDRANKVRLIKPKADHRTPEGTSEEAPPKKEPTKTSRHHPTTPTAEE